MWGLTIYLGFIALIFLVAITWTSIQNMIENHKLGEIWKAQNYKYDDLRKCPGCGFPHVFGRVEFEGLPIILKKYYWEDFKCQRCDFKYRFVVKWNGLNGDEE